MNGVSAMRASRFLGSCGIAILGAVLGCFSMASAQQAPNSLPENEAKHLAEIERKFGGSIVAARKQAKLPQLVFSPAHDARVFACGHAAKASDQARTDEVVVDPDQLPEWAVKFAASHYDQFTH